MVLVLYTLGSSKILFPFILLLVFMALMSTELNFCAFSFIEIGSNESRTIMLCSNFNITTIVLLKGMIDEYFVS